MAKKKIKKAVKKVAKKSAPKSKPSRHEIMVSVQSVPTIPTTQQLSEPLTTDGKKLTLQKTWLAQNQLLKMLQRTPREQIYRRKGKGGQMFDYVTGSYALKWLNFTFAWNWDFDIVEHGKEKDHVWVLGRLTVRGTQPNQEIKKTQFGRSEVKYKKGSQDMVDYGNDLKAAATDALKKCASLLGFASDIYGKMDYKEETNLEPVEVLPAQATPAKTTPATPTSSLVTGKEKPVLRCQVCTKPISEAEADYSQKIFRKHLCREHQSNKK